MKINKTELLKALEKVKPGLASKEIVEQSTSFAFMDGRIVTYNDEISISHTIGAVGIEGAVQAKELYQFLNRAEADTIEIEQDDNEIKLSAGKAKAGVTLKQEIKLPLDELGEFTEWITLPPEFIMALDFCRFSCSKDMSAPVFTCVHVNARKGVVESTDSCRITRHKIKKSRIPAFLLPASSAHDLVRYGITEVAQSPGWMHFRTADKKIIFSCRIFADNFPDIGRFLEIEGQSITLPKTLLPVLDRASVFAQRDYDADEIIQVELAKNAITISANSTAGWFKEELEIKYNEAPIKFITNPKFLQDMLSKIEDCIIGEAAIKFTGPNWEHAVVLPAANETA